MMPPTDMSEKQVTMWTFIDQVLVKYGPLGVMLCLVIYYVVTKDQLIANKDALLMAQQQSMMEMTRTQTEALTKAGVSQVEVARSVDENTKAITRLVAQLERQH